MIEKIQQYLDEKTNGMIHTRKEVVYLITIIALIVALIFSFVIKASVV